MKNYTEFKVEAEHDDKQFCVLVSTKWVNWCSGYIYTNYFSMHYPTKQKALDAIEGYKNRFTTVS